MRREPDQATVGRIFRAESGRTVATLIRVFGDIDLAEDAVQDAFTTALRTWPAAGLPPQPQWVDHHDRPQTRVGPAAPRVAWPELLGEVALLWPGRSASRCQEVGDRAGEVRIVAAHAVARS